MALHMDISQNVPQDEMYEKFQIDRPGKITFIGHHLSAKDTMRCLVRTISSTAPNWMSAPIWKCRPISIWKFWASATRSAAR